MTRHSGRSVRDIPPRRAALLGAILSAAGFAILSVGLGVIELPPGQVRAPLWIVGLAGLLFVFMGLTMVAAAWSPPSPGRDGEEAFSTAGWVLGGLFVTTFAVVTGWIAFGPGERAFGGGISLPFVRIGGGESGGELRGRIAFGVVAVLAGALAVRGWLYGLRRLRGRGSATPDVPTEADR